MIISHGGREWRQSHGLDQDADECDLCRRRGIAHRVNDKRPVLDWPVHENIITSDIDIDITSTSYTE